MERHRIIKDQIDNAIKQRFIVKQQLQRHQKQFNTSIIQHIQMLKRDFTETKSKNDMIDNITSNQQKKDQKQNKKQIKCMKFDQFYKYMSCYYYNDLFKNNMQKICHLVPSSLMTEGGQILKTSSQKIFPLGKKMYGLAYLNYYYIYENKQINIFLRDNLPNCRSLYTNITRSMQKDDKIITMVSLSQFFGGPHSEKDQSGFHINIRSIKQKKQSHESLRKIMNINEILFEESQKYRENYLLEYSCNLSDTLQIIGIIFLSDLLRFKFLGCDMVLVVFKRIVNSEQNCTIEMILFNRQKPIQEIKYKQIKSESYIHKQIFTRNFENDFHSLKIESESIYLTLSNQIYLIDVKQIGYENSRKTIKSKQQYINNQIQIRFIKMDIQNRINVFRSSRQKIERQQQNWIKKPKNSQNRRGSDPQNQYNLHQLICKKSPSILNKHNNSKMSVKSKLFRSKSLPYGLAQSSYVNIQDEDEDLERETNLEDFKFFQDSTNQIVSSYFEEGYSYIITKDLHLYELENDKIIVAEELISLIYNHNQGYTPKNNDSSSQSEFNIEINQKIVQLDLQFMNNCGLILIIRTEYNCKQLLLQNQLPTRNNANKKVDSSVYIYKIRRREIQFYRKISNLYENIKISKLTNYSCNIDNDVDDHDEIQSYQLYDLKMVMFDSEDSLIYYQWTKQKSVQINFQPASKYQKWIQIAQVSILNGYQGPTQENDLFQERFFLCNPKFFMVPIKTFILERNQANNRQALYTQNVKDNLNRDNLLILNSFRSQATVIMNNQIPYFAKFFWYSKKNLFHFVHKFAKKPICAAINHNQLMKTFLVSFGNVVKEYSIIQDNNLTFLHENFQLRIENIKFMEYTKNMQNLFLWDGQSIIIVDPWGFSIKRIILCQALPIRSLAKLSVNKVHLIVHHNGPIHLSHKKYQPINQSKQIKIRLYPLDSCLVSNTQQSMNQFDISSYNIDTSASCYTSSQEFFIYVYQNYIKIFPLHSKQINNFRDISSFQLTINFLENGEKITGIKIQERIIIMTSNWGKIRISHLSLPFQYNQKGVGNEQNQLSVICKYIKKVREVDLNSKKPLLIILQESQITTDCLILDFFIESHKQFKIICITSTYQIIHFQVKICETLKLWDKQIHLRNVGNNNSMNTMQSIFDHKKYRLCLPKSFFSLNQTIIMLNLKSLESQEKYIESIQQYKQKLKDQCEIYIHKIENSNNCRRLEKIQAIKNHEMSIQKLKSSAIKEINRLKEEKKAIKQQNNKQFIRETKVKTETIKNYNAKNLMELKTRFMEELYELNTQHQRAYSIYATEKNQMLQQIQKQIDKLRVKIEINKHTTNVCQIYQQDMHENMKKQMVLEAAKQFQAHENRYTELSMRSLSLLDGIKNMNEKINMLEKNQVILHNQIKQMEEKRKDKKNAIKQLVEVLDKAKSYLNFGYQKSNNIKFEKKLVALYLENQYRKFQSAEKTQKIKQYNIKLRDLQIKKQQISHKLLDEYTKKKTLSENHENKKQYSDKLIAKLTALKSRRYHQNRKIKLQMNQQIQEIFQAIKNRKKITYQKKDDNSQQNRLHSSLIEQIDKTFKASQQYQNIKTNKNQHQSKCQQKQILKLNKQNQNLIREYNSLNIEQKQLKKQLEILKEKVKKKYDQNRKTTQTSNFKRRSHSEPIPQYCPLKNVINQEQCLKKTKKKIEQRMKHQAKDGECLYRWRTKLPSLEKQKKRLSLGDSEKKINQDFAILIKQNRKVVSVQSFKKEYYIRLNGQKAHKDAEEFSDDAKVIKYKNPRLYNSRNQGYVSKKYQENKVGQTKPKLKL